MKNENFVFENKITGEEKEKMNKYSSITKELSRGKMEGEIEKNEEELKFLKFANKYIKEELQSFGIEEFEDIDPNQFHFLNEEAYCKATRNLGSLAFVVPLLENAYVNIEEMPHRLQLYKTILHEALHLYSFQRNQVYIEDGEDGDEEKYLLTYRYGYSNDNMVKDKFGEDHSHFMGLNEAMTDLIVLDILRGHQRELIKEFNVTFEEALKPVSYNGYKDLFIFIMQKIAENLGEDYEDVWGRFKKGYFTGEMMHLRDIEKVFGKGSTRFLAAIDSFVRDTNTEMDKEVFAFFETDDEHVREQIAQKVLDDREWNAYLKRRYKDNK
ncbi:MAG: hypothetical protein ACWGHO_05555 [Candidatus Moraniibacteriota bacterium]